MSSDQAEWKGEGPLVLLGYFRRRERNTCQTRSFEGKKNFAWVFDAEFGTRTDFVRVPCKGLACCVQTPGMKRSGPEINSGANGILSGEKRHRQP